MKYPKISIVTPSYNQGEFLERTLQSVLNQQYPNLEYLVIDGGSTDNSVEVIEQYQNHLAYWVSEKDSGQVEAINKGLKKATGEWLAFQNSDDLYTPNTFEVLVKAIEKYPKAEVLYGDIFLIDAQDQAFDLIKTTPFRIENQLLLGMQIHNQAMFVKRSVFERIGYFDDRFDFSFDSEFVCRLGLHGINTQKIEGLRGQFRMHEAAKSLRIREVSMADNEKIKKEYLPKLSLQNNSSQWQWVKYQISKIGYHLGQADVKFLFYKILMSLIPSKKYALTRFFYAR